MVQVISSEKRMVDSCQRYLLLQIQIGTRNHPATTREAPMVTHGKAAVAAEPGVPPVGGRTLEIPGTSTATHFAFGDLTDHTGQHKVPEPFCLSNMGASAS